MGLQRLQRTLKITLNRLFNLLDSQLYRLVVFIIALFLAILTQTYRGNVLNKDWKSFQSLKSSPPKEFTPPQKNYSVVI